MKGVSVWNSEFAVRNDLIRPVRDADAGSIGNGLAGYKPAPREAGQAGQQVGFEFAADRGPGFVIDADDLVGVAVGGAADDARG